MEPQKQVTPKPIGFCQDKAMLCNLMLMTVFWTASSFCYYLMSFYLKYIPGNIYLNVCLACMASIVGHCCSGFVMKAFGIKLAFVISYVLAGAGGLFLVMFFSASDTLIAVFVLFA